MHQFKFITAVILSALGIHSARLPARGAPTLVNDDYSVTEDTPLSGPAPGVLSNDVADPPGSVMLPVLGSQPAHGAVVLNGDGSFIYTPAANYAGPDAFNYLVAGARNFTVDQARSILTIASTVTVTALGPASATDTGKTSGTMSILLNPTSGTFQLAQVQNLNVALAERVDLRFCWLFCLTQLNANILANGLNLGMVRAGPPAAVAPPNGIFNQTGNILSAVGTVNLSGSGLAGVEIPPTIAINSTDIAYDLTNARVYLNGAGNIEVKVPLDVTQVFSDPGGAYSGTIRITGDIYATAPVNPLPPSTSAVVTLTVDPVDDAPVALADQYYTLQNTPITIPASAAVSTETLIPALSTWKYLTGVNPGTTWRALDYDDSAWLSGMAILGYGDADITGTGVIKARANTAAAASTTNPNYATALFRREFTLAAPYDTVQPKIEVQRDDACAVYINGVEVYRDSTPYAAGGPIPLDATGEIAWADYARATIPNADEMVYKEVTFPRGLLRGGKNVVAVEVHQASAVSSDMRFDLRASRTRGVAGLLANDADADGPAMEVVSDSLAQGTVVVNADGSFSYTPPMGFTGTDSFYYLHQPGGAPITSESSLVAMNAVWRYLDDGTVAPQNAGMTAADWRNAAFNDLTWKSGAGELGYGDNDEVTVVEDDATAGSPTAGSTTRHVTTYFRHKFTYGGALPLVQSLRARVVRDDGVAVFLNGHRILLNNLPEGWTQATLAQTSISGTDESTPVELLDIPTSYLLAGRIFFPWRYTRLPGTAATSAFAWNCWPHLRSAPGWTWWWWMTTWTMT